MGLTDRQKAPDESYTLTTAAATKAKKTAASTVLVLLIRKATKKEVADSRFTRTKGGYKQEM